MQARQAISDIGHQARGANGRVRPGAILAGVLAGFLFAAVATGILAVVYVRTSLPESPLSWMVSSVNLLSVAIAGLVSGRRARTTGWLNGGLAGFCFTFLAILLSYVLFPQAIPILAAAARLGIGLGLGLLGGTVGVNLA